MVRTHSKFPSFQVLFPKPSSWPLANLKLVQNCLHNLPPSLAGLLTMLPRPKETILTISQALHSAMRPKPPRKNRKKGIDNDIRLCYHMPRRTTRREKPRKKALDKAIIACYYVTDRTKRQRRPCEDEQENR